MTTQEEFVNHPTIARARGGRPIIQKPDGKMADYTRASSLGRLLDDETKLNAWKLRQAIIGLASRKSLVVAASAHSLDNEKMDEIIELALDAAGAGDAAVAGTAVHELCDRLDQGQDPFVPEDYEDGVNSYLWVTQGLEVVVSEKFGVCDAMEAAGTPDRVYRLRGPATMPDGTVLPAGTLVIGDVKTCRTLDFGEIDFGVQLAIYAHSQRYDISGGDTGTWKRRKVAVGTREDWVPGEQVNHEWALIVWIPAGTGTAELRPVDLTLGWELAHLAEEVRLKRKAVSGKVIHAGIRVHEDFAYTLEHAQTVDDLMAAYKRAMVAEVWTPELKELFGERRADIEEAELVA